MNSNRNLEAALFYAAKGWAVIPLHAPVNGACTCGKASCSSVGKHPATPNGFKDASKDPETIKRWWSKNPAYNVGIATGSVSGILVLDVDDAKGGTEGLRQLEEMAGPCTLGAGAMSGAGRHFYYEYPDGSLLRSRTQLAGIKGVDTRADGGYIVAPPSVHANGNTYRWLERGQIPPPLPDGLKRFLEDLEKPKTVAPAHPGTRTSSSISDIIGQLQEGNRNTSFTSLVGHLWARGLDVEAIYALLLPQVKQSGFPEPEFEAVVRSITSRPQGNMFHASSLYRQEAEAEWVEPEVLSLGDFVGKEYPDQPWVIEPFLPEVGATIMAGMEGQGKTWIGLDMALDVASDRLWMGKFKTKKKKVVILDQESNPGFLQGRVRGLLEAKGLKAEDLEVTFVFSEGLRFLNPKALESFEKVLEEKQPGMVIVDSFIRAFGDDENSAQHVARFLAKVKQLAKKYNTAFLLTDHHKKGAPGFASSQMIRGSSDKAAWADVVLTVWNDEGEINIDHSKHRWSKKHDTLLVELAEPQAGVYEVRFKGEKGAKAIEDDDDVVHQMLFAVLAQGASLSRTELIAEAKERAISEKVLDAVLKRMVASRFLIQEAEREAGKRGKKPHRFRWAFGALSILRGDIPDPSAGEGATPPSEPGQGA